MGPFQIERVRALHSRIQRSWLWRVVFYGGTDQSQTSGSLEDLSLLAQSVSVPGWNLEMVPYFIGGGEKYFPRVLKTGGVVRCKFLEVEERTVQKFFLRWVSEGVSRNKSSTRQEREAKDYIVREAVVTSYSQEVLPTFQCKLHGLLPEQVGEYEFSYDNSSPMILPVTLRCDDVEFAL